MKAKLSLGLMSGTSVDGIDAVLLHSEAKKDHVLFHEQFEYPAALRSDILSLIGSLETSLSNFTRIHYAIGDAFATAAEKTIKAALKKKILPKQKDLLLIGSHGQTVFHHPEEKRTLQIGEASLIAARTGITTVSDFRVADTAAGGEGAPLLPLYHQRLFRDEAKRGISIHNLGGISNFTYLGPKQKIFALDTGPANCLIDLFIQRISSGAKKFDENGTMARSGKLLPEVLEFLLQQDDIKKFHALPAPKSTGRELFSKSLLEKLGQKFPGKADADILRTLLQFSVRLILDNYQRLVLKKKLPLEEIVFCGGGTGNSYLLSLLQEELPTVEFRTMEDYGLSSQALEAQAFAYFALAALAGESISHPQTTGVKQAVICGKISPGENWKQL